MDHSESNRKLARIALWILAGAALLAGLGEPPVRRTQEARVLVTAREMVVSPDGLRAWLVPHLNAHIRLEKPPLAYWAAAGAFEMLEGRQLYSVGMFINPGTFINAEDLPIATPIAVSLRASDNPCSQPLRVGIAIVFYNFGEAQHACAHAQTGALGGVEHEGRDERRIVELRRLAEPVAEPQAHDVAHELGVDERRGLAGQLGLLLREGDGGQREDGPQKGGDQGGTSHGKPLGYSISFF